MIALVVMRMMMMLLMRLLVLLLMMVMMLMMVVVVKMMVMIGALLLWVQSDSGARPMRWQESLGWWEWCFLLFLACYYNCYYYYYHYYNIYIYIHNHFVSFCRRSVAYKYGFPECLWLKGFSLKSTYSMFPSCLMLQPARHLTSSKTTDPRFR